jgi:hypothetical protein
MARKEYREVHLKGECPQKDILILEDHEGVRKKYENSTSRKKKRKEDFRRKIREYQKIP